MGHLTAWPWLEVTDPVLIQREAGKFRRFQNLGFEFASKGRVGDRTRMQLMINRTGCPESSL